MRILTEQELIDALRSCGERTRKLKESTRVAADAELPDPTAANPPPQIPQPMKER